MNLVALIVALFVLSAMGWQHRRYLSARRGPVQDRQDLIYGKSVLHVVSFLRLPADVDPIEALRKLRASLETSNRARMVYAGRAASVGLDSAQIAETAWDAVILMQYSSREAFDSIAQSSAYRGAFDGFDGSYSHGMDRPVVLNLALPMLLLGLRAFQIVTRAPSIYPLEPAEPETRDPRAGGSQERMGQLDGLKEYSEDALVVVNLLKSGTRKERDADRSYGLKMAKGFAEGAHGPMHIGRAVSLDGKAQFDSVAIVFYPGIDYMQRLMASTFFNGIVGNKQPADTLAVPTVPILARL